jgi:hypothetical protein
MSRVIAVMACGFSLAACSASLPSLGFLKSSPPVEALRIESDPPGADARTSQGQSCRTPCELTVQTGGELSVTLALSGYQPQTISVRQELPPASGPQDAEIATSGARLAPNPVYAELVPAPAAPPPKKPAVKKKKPATATGPAPTTTASTAAAPAPAVIPAPVTEPATSTTNYPWPSR